jgi:hypothetical protein
MRGLVLNVWVGEPPMNDDCGRPRGLEGMGMVEGGSEAETEGRLIFWGWDIVDDVARLD